MGCVGSAYDDVPVTGYQGGALEVLPNNQQYVQQEPTILKLKEKFFSFSGDDCVIKDLSGSTWFKINAETFSMSNKRSMMDTEGRVIAGYRKKLLSMHATAYITGEVNGRTLVYATIKKESMMSFVASAEIFLHNPPVDIDNVTTDGLNAEIRVEGDFFAKKYDFMMGNRDNPYKVAQVVRKWMTFMENNSYYVNIGTNMDVAFVCMCAMAIDELFCEQK
eukprot:GFUD01012921.1.p1 GENE.GFUD01012921.1~~GFUD01012921.1.p1  ORF type:complete len:239 (+),score=46.11 GFUD01012921.1:60-719(+)